MIAKDETNFIIVRHKRYPLQSENNGEYWAWKPHALYL